MNIISIYTHHNCAISLWLDGEIYNFEFERLTKKRYISILKYSPQDFEKWVSDALDCINRIWDLPPTYDLCVLDKTLSMVEPYNGIVKRLIPAKKYTSQHHHHSHAANAFYQSPYDESLIFSYDGIGSDGCFNAYHAKHGHIEQLELGRIHSLGHLYRDIALAIKEIHKNKNWTLTRTALAVSGKLMGLTAYGEVRQSLLDAFIEYYKTSSFESVNRVLAHLYPEQSAELLTMSDYWQKVQINKEVIPELEGQPAYDVALANQMAFEETFLRHTMPLIIEYKDLPICLAGGCSLNVLMNERLRRLVGNRIFVAPNTDDSGISLGQMFLEYPPPQKVQVTYSGLPILDLDELPQYIAKYSAKKTTIAEMCDILRKGEIIGIVQGDSEVGPRALGNRSIICDPSFPDMKDRINKIKHREWFRPFAPVVRLEDSNTYFYFDYDSRFMSFAPIVREEWRKKFPAITHADNTARLQTVTHDQNALFYDLLTELGGVILNTSFNIKGAPILTTLADAFEVLETTTLDHVYVEGYIFSKPDKKEDSVVEITSWRQQS